MIIGLGGKLSGGKTNTAVAISLDKAYKGKKVISNIYLNFPPKLKTFYLKNENFIEFLIKNYNNPPKIKEVFFNSVLLLDEVGQLINARKSSSNLNELITSFFMMVGKLDCDVIFTYQVKESQVDKVLREVCEIYGNCFRLSKDLNPIFFEDRILNTKIYVLVLLEFDLQLAGKQIKPILYDPEPFYNLYDTREIVLLNRAQYQRGGSKDLRI